MYKMVIFPLMQPLDTLSQRLAQCCNARDMATRIPALERMLDYVVVFQFQNFSDLFRRNPSRF